MKEMFKKTILVLCGVLILCSVLYLFKIRFQNIDMTELRLFITYWKECLTSIFVIIISGVIFDMTFKKIS